MKTFTKNSQRREKQTDVSQNAFKPRQSTIKAKNRNQETYRPEVKNLLNSKLKAAPQEINLSTEN